MGATKTRDFTAHAHIAERILDGFSQRRRKLGDAPFPQIGARLLVHSQGRHARSSAGPDGALSLGLALVLLIGDVFQPSDVLAVEMLLQRNVYHLGPRPRAMPVLFLRRNPHRVARANLPHRAAPALDAAEAGDHVQGLAERMGMPGGSRARLKPYPRATD